MQIGEPLLLLECFDCGGVFAFGSNDATRAAADPFPRGPKLYTGPVLGLGYVPAMVIGQGWNLACPMNNVKDADYDDGPDLNPLG